MKKVKFVKSPSCDPWNLAYSKGDTASVTNAVADDLIKAKFAVDSDEEAARVKQSEADNAEAIKAAEAAAEEKAKQRADAEVGKVTRAEKEKADAVAEAKKTGKLEEARKEAQKQAEIEKAEGKGIDEKAVKK